MKYEQNINRDYVIASSYLYMGVWAFHKNIFLSKFIDYMRFALFCVAVSHQLRACFQEINEIPLRYCISYVSLTKELQRQLS